MVVTDILVALDILLTREILRAPGFVTRRSRTLPRRSIPRGGTSVGRSEAGMAGDLSIVYGGVLDIPDRRERAWSVKIVVPVIRLTGAELDAESITELLLPCVRST
jgi:hypothetical protein